MLEQTVRSDDEHAIERSSTKRRGTRASRAEPSARLFFGQPIDFVADDPRFAVAHTHAGDERTDDHDERGGLSADPANVRVASREELGPRAHVEGIATRVTADSLNENIGGAVAVPETTGAIRDSDNDSVADRTNVKSILATRTGAGNLET